MSTLRNQVQLIGHLGTDAKIKMTSQGRPYAQVIFATNELYKASSGKWKKDTQWHTLAIWGDQLTKKLGKYGAKGSQLLVNGVLQYREYVDKRGVKQMVTEVWVKKLIPFQNKVKLSKVAAVVEA